MHLKKISSIRQLYIIVYLWVLSSKESCFSSALWTCLSHIMDSATRTHWVGNRSNHLVYVSLISFVSRVVSDPLGVLLIEDTFFSKSNNSSNTDTGSFLSERIFQYIVHLNAYISFYHEFSETTQNILRLAIDFSFILFQNNYHSYLTYFVFVLTVFKSSLHTRFHYCVHSGFHVIF